MPISFNSIPVGIRTPGQYIEFDSSRAVQGLPELPHRALIIAQRLAAGSVLQAVPTLIPNPDVPDGYFGRGSYLAEMCKAFKRAAPYVELWAVALDDIGGGAAAAGTLTVTVTTAKAGTIFLLGAGRLIPVPVQAGDAQNAIAINIAAAINAQTDLPFTAAAVANVVTTTARHKGTQGNGIDLRLNYYPGQALPAGVTVAIVAMAGGATDPDVATALVPIAAQQYHTIASGLNDATSVGKLEVELETRWGPMVQMEGHAFAAVVGTVGAMQALGAARNSKQSTLMGAGKSPTPPWIWAAVAAGVDAAEPDPARPRQTLPLLGVLPPAQADVPSQPERNVLLKDGISTFTVNVGEVLVERLITTYQTNAQAVEDVAFLDIMSKRTLSALRYTQRARIALKFPRHKLANDGTNFAPGQAIVTPSIIRGELLAWFTDMETAGWVEGFEQYKTDLVVERSVGDVNRVDVLQSPDIINAFMVYGAQMQFLL